MYLVQMNVAKKVEPRVRIRYSKTLKIHTALRLLYLYNTEHCTQKNCMTPTLRIALPAHNLQNSVKCLSDPPTVCVAPLPS